MSIDPTPITAEQKSKADAVIKWNETLQTEVERVLSKHSDATQLELTRLLKGELLYLFSSYPGTFGLRVDPKGDKQIQVILTLDQLGAVPSVKIKHRYNVPSLIEEVTDA